ncbi:MAG TPA: MoxR family ATPase [bacterium]|nr:MoxR family ATPase [bacterium]HOL65972.1 MoxR family ATPase [bacterium]HPP12324.1 MoxR family ATPase [bacterium]
MTDDLKLLEELQEARQKILQEVHRVVVGQEEIIEGLLVGLFSGGHCLLIGVPGLAKTLMVRTLARALDLTFKRIQFTPDLMPSDITGTEVIQQDASSFERSFKFVPGPIFANLVLADEINRAPPKTQAALLESMQEYQVTAGGVRYPLPLPFLVLATQNPIELEGTYPLPEAQLDRFMFSIYLNYPATEEEKKIAELTGADIEVEVARILNAEKILTYQALVKRIPVSEHVVDFAVRLARATRPGQDGAPDFVKDFVSWGAGPRASQYLVLGARARAALRGDVNVSTADVKEVASSVLRHRIFTNFNADAEGIDAAKIVQRLLQTVPEIP